MNINRQILADEVRRMKRHYGFMSHKTFNEELIDKTYALVKDWSTWGDMFIQPKTGQSVSAADALITVGGYDVFEYYYGSFSRDWEFLQSIEDYVNGISRKEREAIILNQEIEDFEFALQFGEI